MGAVFGLTSVWKAFTATSSLVAPLLAASPVLVIVMSLGSRLLVPVVAGAVYRGIAKRKSTLAAILAPIAGSLTNTVCYLGSMLLFYIISGIDASAVLAIVAGVGALNGSCEAVAAALICVADYPGASAAKIGNKIIFTAKETRDAHCHRCRKYEYQGWPV